PLRRRGAARLSRANGGRGRGCGSQAGHADGGGESADSRRRPRQRRRGEAGEKPSRGEGKRLEEARHDATNAPNWSTWTEGPQVVRRGSPSDRPSAIPRGNPGSRCVARHPDQLERRGSGNRRDGGKASRENSAPDGGSGSRRSRFSGSGARLRARTFRRHGKQVPRLLPRALPCLPGNGCVLSGGKPARFAQGRLGGRARCEDVL